MDQSLYLIAAGADDGEILDRLAAAFGPDTRQSPQAVLVARGERSEGDYARLALGAIALAQPHDCAVLLDNAPDKVAELRADGVHITGGLTNLREAIEALKPDFIVGTGGIGSRHDAMVRGELDLDYLMFGDTGADGADLATWWAETFEIPAVYLAEHQDEATATPPKTEFLAYLLADWFATETAP